MEDPDFEKKVKQLSNPRLRQVLREADRQLKARDRVMRANAPAKAARQKAQTMKAPTIKTMGKVFGKGFAEGLKRFSPIPQISIISEIFRSKPAGQGSAYFGPGSEQEKK